ncbi:MAG: hypothetical protein GY903_05530 [Fuerstiella sp.]|nr:hypothetical protein [Fuerstiella sp.]
MQESRAYRSAVLTNRFGGFQAMVDGGIVRTSLNRNIGRIRRMFKWGVENELEDPAVHTALTALVSLRYGRSAGVPDVHFV